MRQSIKVKKKNYLITSTRSFYRYQEKSMGNSTIKLHMFILFSGEKSNFFQSEIFNYYFFLNRTKYQKFCLGVHICFKNKKLFSRAPFIQNKNKIKPVKY